MKAIEKRIIFVNGVIEKAENPNSYSLELINWGEKRLKELQEQQKQEYESKNKIFLKITDFLINYLKIFKYQAIFIKHLKYLYLAF